MSLSGKASIHLVHKSVMTRMYLLPCEDMGRGYIMSHDNFLKGVLLHLYPVGLPGLAVVDSASDTAQDCINSPTGQYLAHIVASNM